VGVKRGNCTSYFIANQFRRSLKWLGLRLKGEIVKTHASSGVALIEIYEVP